MKPSTLIAFIGILVAIGVGSHYFTKDNNAAKDVTSNEDVLQKGVFQPEQDTAELHPTIDTPGEFLPVIEDNSGAAAPPAQLENTNTVPKSESALPKTHQVSIQNFAFSPANITIKRGDKVTFTNRDSMQHSATTNGAFDTGLISPGESKTITFSNPGVFDYHCTPHPQMKGSITVQ